MSKRAAAEARSAAVPTGQPPLKKVLFEPHLIGTVSTLKEMDIKVLQFQNKKLAQRIEQTHRCEVGLRQRIEQLKKRQTQDDTVLCVVNRYWNLLNEDIRVLLQRFDAETADESENNNEIESTTSFLMQLSTWDKEELDEKLANRVQVSKRAVAKILQAFDRLQQRNEKIALAIRGELGEDGDRLKLDDVVREANEELQASNRTLQALNTALHMKHHTSYLYMAQLQDSLNSKETENAELKNQIDDLQYELIKIRSRNDKLENHLAEAIEKLKSYHQAGTGAGGTSTSASSQEQLAPRTTLAGHQLEDLQKEMEDQRELANNRLAELEQQHQKHCEALKDVEKLKMDIHQLPKSVIVETTEYKCLQSLFSVLYNESVQIRSALDKTRQQLQGARKQHLQQIQMMECEELARQKTLRAKIIQLEDVIEQLREEYETLGIVFEQNLEANEQTGPINREMRHLITSLHEHNGQLEGEVQRYKLKYKDTSQQLHKVKESRVGDSREGPMCEAKPGKSSPKCKDGKQEPVARPPPIKCRELEIIEDLKQQLKKTVTEQKELNLLLDMYKNVSKEPRDKAQLMAAERKVRQELDEYRQKLQESKSEQRLSDEDAMRKIKQLEEQKHELQKHMSVAASLCRSGACGATDLWPTPNFNFNAKPFAGSHEEEALLNEMEVTGQAFDDMLEQNSRLIQRLIEKDDANFKLMSDRIKANSLQKLLQEEKQLLQEQVSTRDQQIDAMALVRRKLEEKERLLENTLTAMEKELVLRQQAMEMHKRKAIESAHSAADLKLHLDKYHLQMKDAQQVLAEKTSALEAEAYKAIRVHEELAMLRRKVDRIKKMEQAGSSMDEVLSEEIREYKETLTCPSCKVKRKDAVLSKCFHVFCWDCLKARYETRQRKCPKCNSAFGANDFHRLYLST